jgi:PAS domain S-box-containing protein
MTTKSEHMLLEFALRDAGLDFTKLIDAMPLMIWTTIADGRCDFVNRRWAEYVGLPAESLTGEQWLQCVHPHDRENVVKWWTHAARAGQGLQIDFRIRRHDGIYRWFDTRASPLRDAQGAIVKWCGVNIDIDDARVARHALMENEERLRYVSLATYDSVYDWDMRAGIVRNNEAYQSSFGVPAVVHTDDRWWERHIHPEDRERVFAEATAMFRAHRPQWSHEYRLRRPDGSYAFVIDRGYVLYDSEQRPVRMIGAMLDITDRKLAEQTLRDQQVRLSTALENGGMATWIWEVAGDKLWWDEAAYRLWGRTPRELPDLSLAHVITMMHPEDRERVQEASAEFFRTGFDTAVEFRTLRPDGALQWLFVKGKIERDATGKPTRMAGVYVDITQRKRTEEAQLRSQKMEALGTLAGGIAHDFNNILLAVSGNAKLAIEDMTEILPADHSVHRNLREIERASARAADLVKRILAFSRQQETKDEIVQLRPIIEEALRLLRPTLPCTVEIRQSYANNLPSVAIDSIQFHQVIMNLITNAAQSIGDRRGTIGVGLGVQRNDSSAPPELAKLGGDEYVSLTVSDSGDGIPKEALDRIFDPFFTTKEAGQGTGLGLAVVHGIVTSHGGVVAVASEVGHGATFRVYFPAVRTQGALSVPAPRPAAARSQGEHILYVDDEEPLVFLVANVLERLGYRVTGCIDPVEGLRQFRSSPQSFDAVVTDLSMPGLSGFELINALYAVRRDIPILLTSGYVRTEDRERARSVGVQELILKPNTVEELGQAIDRVLRRRDV